MIRLSGFGGAEVAFWPLITKFAGSNPAEAVGFLRGDKNPQHKVFYELMCWLFGSLNCRLPNVMRLSGFGGAEVACWPLIPKFAC